ncbi:MAG TPA: amidohydrolase family protein [Vicinamibacterales bacterium]|nr:amidohydrolase family protein [Vicinamibacterales bacterium]
MIPLINDAHCHFFSQQFFETLGRQRGPGTPSAAQITAELGWTPPGSPEELADAWALELDKSGVARAALIASVPQDEESVARAVARHQSRFVGFFMLDPTSPDAAGRVERALHELKLRCVCLFPAMQRYSLHDPSVKAVVDVVAAHRQPTAAAAIFVHCGALSVGVRKKLGLPSRFDVRHGNPLDLHALAADHPQVPFIIPHFGAGFLREALLVADLCPNIYLDTSSSNRWLSYLPGLTLADVFRQAIETIGFERLLFGTDSSFFPRGWNRSIYDTQMSAMRAAGADERVRGHIFATNFDRLFPAESSLGGGPALAGPGV